MAVPDMIVLGRIVGPYGLQGWVRLHPFGDDAESLGRMRRWWLGADDCGDAWHVHALEQLKPHGQGWVVKFAGIDGRDAAEAIDGMYVAAPRSALPETAANEYYWVDLIGLDVVNVRGESLGRVTEMLSGAAHDVLCVEAEIDGKRRRRLLPFVAQVVKGVDRAGSKIRVDWESDW